MNENIVELLLYLFENYIYENDSDQLDEGQIQQGLTQAGFSSKAINNAFTWLEDLQEDVITFQAIQIDSDSYRVFTDSEQLKLDTECRDFIYYLNSSEILDSIQREILINAVMNLKINHIDIDELQWLALLVLFSQPDQQQALAHLEELIFETDDFYEH